MFSLIITIISIALVAALALATLYFGGDAFERGSSEAQASKLVLQSQQISGALSLYEIDHGSLPNTSDLSFLTQVSPVTGKVYLKQIPLASLQEPSLVSTALANTAMWRLVPETKTIYTQAPVSAEVCRKVNERVRGDDGVLSVVSTTYTTQCFEESEGVYKIFTSLDKAFEEASIPPQRIVNQTVSEIPLSSSLWTIPPGSEDLPSITPPSNSTGSSLNLSLLQNLSLTYQLTSSNGNYNLQLANATAGTPAMAFLGITNTSATSTSFSTTNSLPQIFNNEEMLQAFGLSQQDLNAQIEQGTGLPLTACGTNQTLQPGEVCVLLAYELSDNCIARSGTIAGLNLSHSCSSIPQAPTDPYAGLRNIGLVIVAGTPPVSDSSSDFNLANFGTMTTSSNDQVQSYTVYNSTSNPIGLSLGLNNNRAGNIPYEYSQSGFISLPLNMVNSCSNVVQPKQLCNIQIRTSGGYLINKPYGNYRLSVSLTSDESVPLFIVVDQTNPSAGVSPIISGSYFKSVVLLNHVEN